MGKNKTILISLNSFWVNNKGMSGGDEMTFQIFKRIESEFESIFWITNNDGALIIESLFKNTQIIITPKYFDRLPVAIGYFLRMCYSFMIIIRYKFDIIYSSSDFFPDVMPSWLYKKLNKKVTWIQCIYHLYPSHKIRAGNKIINFLLEIFQKFSFYLSKNNSKIVTINKDVHTQLKELGFKSDNLEIITPGIDFHSIQSLSNNLVGVKNVDAIFLGRIKISKGIFDLLDIWSLVIRKNPNSKLAIIGSGEEKIQKELNKQIRLKKLQKSISIVGFVDTQKKYELMKNSKVFIFPSHEEGFGIAIAEALACSMNVIAWNLPVYDEIYGENITTVDFGDVSKFSQEILKFINKNLENISGKNFSKKFDWEIVSKKMKKWILQ
jgi:glycosyltransferase involved in cell wall biosynthesis